MENNPKVFGNRLATRSEVSAALGDALLRIKCADKLTLDDMGDVLGKGPDMVAFYIAGEHLMDTYTYLRARAAWGTRFTHLADDLMPAGVGDVA